MTRRAALPSESALHAGWRERASALGFGGGEVAAVLWRERGPARPPDRPDRIADALAGPDGLTADRSQFDRLRVVRAFCERGGVGLDAREAERLADEFLASGRVVELPRRRAGRRAALHDAGAAGRRG